MISTFKLVRSQSNCCLTLKFYVMRTISKAVHTIFEIRRTNLNGLHPILKYFHVTFNCVSLKLKNLCAQLSKTAAYIFQTGEHDFQTCEHDFQTCNHDNQNIEHKLVSISFNVVCKNSWKSYRHTVSKVVITTFLESFAPVWMPCAAILNIFIRL